SLIIASISLPGYWLTIPLVDRIGRKTIQIIGFIGMMINFLLMGIFLEQIKTIPTLFIIMYGINFFFIQFGPNTITYLIAAESYPKVVRSTFHGFSAAVGKVGASLGIGGFAPFVATFGISNTF